MISPDTNGLEHQAVSQNTSHLLENLKPNTKYAAYVRAYSNFASDQSERLIFSTPEDGKPTITTTTRNAHYLCESLV